MSVSSTANSDVETDIVTLTRFILQEQANAASSTQVSGDFTLLLNSLQFAFKFIAHNIRRATLVNLIGLSGANNSTGDAQKKLDVIGDDIFINAMKASGKVKVLVSEEQEDLIVFSGDGRYAVVCDPIDGSSNLDAGVSVGTIFGVYRLQEDSSGSIKDVLRPGKELVAAGYTMYGASANLMLTTGNGVNGFTLDNSLGEFILTHPNLRIPNMRSIYSVNEGNSMYWSDGAKKYFESIKFPESGKPYSARYIGSMVADVHRTLLYGGLFAYPADKKSKKGKLRLLYEGFPMAYLMEQAGGKAIDDNGDRILDLVPQEIHERCGLWLGSAGEVDKAKSFLV
uniref:Fructose-1,6-bisphosphatase n=1 Tax=Blastobotrys adeninivorans TaxID=409370 RepID=A0A060THI1_BLAAD